MRDSIDDTPIAEIGQATLYTLTRALADHIHTYPRMGVQAIRQRVIAFCDQTDLVVDWAGERRGGWIWIELSNRAGTCYTIVLPAPNTALYDDGW